MISLLFRLIPLSFIVNVSSCDTFKCLHSSFVEDPTFACYIKKTKRRITSVHVLQNEMRFQATPRRRRHLHLQ